MSAICKTVSLLAVLLISAVPLSANNSSSTEPGYLYRAEFVQAAPGKLLELIEVYKSRTNEHAAAGDESPLWMRHSQGDRWDLLVLHPMGTYAQFYSADRIARRTDRERQLEARTRDLIAWREDLFALGPPVSEIRTAFSKSGFFHVEIFHALAGKESELYHEREMENAYQRELNRPQNFIFVRDRGASWSLFTVGCYRDLKHYAESAGISEKDHDAAARAAGFEAANKGGPYLRSLIADHHDTLAVAVK